MFNYMFRKLTDNIKVNTKTHLIDGTNLTFVKPNVTLSNRPEKKKYQLLLSFCIIMLVRYISTPFIAYFHFTGI